MGGAARMRPFGMIQLREETMNRRERRATAKVSQAAQKSDPRTEDLVARATAARRSGRMAEAEALFRDALRLDPHHALGLFRLGSHLLDGGRLDEAVALLKRAVAVAPAEAAIHANLGVAFRALGLIDEAIAACHRAIALKPDFREAFMVLGGILMDARRPAEAAIAYGRILAMGQADAAVYSRLGVALAEAGRFDDAANAYRRATELEPDSAELRFNMARSLLELDRKPQAITALQQAIATDATFLPAYRLLAGLLQGSGQRQDALTVYAAALKIAPDDPGLRMNHFHLSRHLCRWDEADADVERDLLEADAVLSPFTVLSLSSSPSQQKRFADRWAGRILADGASRLWSPQPDRRDGERIRVGYLSSDFHEHATAYLMAELIERHDRARFEVVAYSYGPERTGDMGRRIAGAFDRFVEIGPLTNPVAARKIHADGIDILVDLKGYTQGSRTDILAWRPAPIQVNYLGFPGTLGEGLADYVIVDPVIAPMADQPHYAERIVQLPHSYQPNDGKRVIGSIPTRADCGLPDGAFVFCSFNNSYKLTPETFDAWMRLLGRLPRAVLWLIEPNGEVKDNLRAEAARRGVAPERLLFAPRIKLSDHLARHACADLFLDCLPYNAHTTASDALWAGLPVLTQEGTTFAGRVASSLLQAVGLPELVTHSAEDYEALAVRLATEPGLLDGFRRRLAADRLSAPLFDAPRYTRNLEAAYARMVEIQRAGRPPEAFAVIE